VFNQEHPDGWHPAVYVSGTMTYAKGNYPIQKQELLALIYALKKWRHYSFGMETTAFTDHPSLATWETNRELFGRKARWIELLCEFPIEIIYWKGQLNIVANALSRRKDYRPINSLSVLENKEMTDAIRKAALNLDTSFFTSFVKENDDCVHQGVLNLSI
jgi:hypothetical protein